MRQSLLLLFALLLMLTGACTKEDDDASPAPYVPSWHVSGVVDFTMQKLSFSSAAWALSVNVEYGNGEQERVRLFLENVPAGLADSIYAPAGYPDFSTIVRFVDSGVDEGTYTLKLVAQGEHSGRREYPFTIRVLPMPNCAAQTPGSYTGSNICAGSSVYGITVQASTSVLSRITFSNLDNNGLQLYADMLCGAGGGGSSGGTRLDIPAQTINGITYGGYGYYYPNSGGSSAFSLRIVQTNLGQCDYYFIR